MEILKENFEHMKYFLEMTCFVVVVAIDKNALLILSHNVRQLI